MEQKCGHCKILLDDNNIAKDVNGEKSSPDTEGNYWCQKCTDEIYEAFFGEEKSETVEGECPSCGNEGKLKPFYNAYGTKQGDKVYCSECLNELEEDDNKALNNYMFRNRF